MNPKRVVLLIIIASCVMIILLSLAGFWQRGSETPRPPQSTDVGDSTTGKKSKGAIEFYNLTMPYERNGRKVADLHLPHGKELLDTEKWLAEKGTLTLYRDEKDETGKPKTLIVTFDEAEVNRKDKSAFLKHRVEVQLQEGITLRTTNVNWNPVSDLITTQEPVTITGKEFEVHGVEMEANRAQETATIKKAVKVILKTETGGIFSDALGGPDKSLGKKKSKKGEVSDKPREVIITCDGELHGKQNPVTITFTKNVRVTSGASYLNCDLLEIRFAEKKITPEKAEEPDKVVKEPDVLSGKKGAGSVEAIAARGNVRFKDGEQSGTGDELVWDAVRRCATLKGKDALFRQKENSITAALLIFSQPDNVLTVPTGGRLTFQTRGKLISEGEIAKVSGATPQVKSSKQPTKTSPESVTVSWVKQMTYKQNKAIFYGDVKAQQAQSLLTADVLEVEFDAQNRVKNVLATGPVALEDEGRKAFGQRLEWSADKGIAWLTGTPTAEVRQGASFLGCPRVGFNRERNRVECIGEGYLLAVTEQRAPKPGKSKSEKGVDLLGLVPGQKKKEVEPNTPDAGKVRVTWKDRMIFDIPTHTATFYKEVRAGRDDLKIHTEELQVVFDESNQKVTKLIAVDPKGQLRIEHPLGKGYGSHVEWNAVEETAILFGTRELHARVELDRGRTLQAEKIYVDIRDQAIHSEGGGQLKIPADKTKSKPKRDEAKTRQSGGMSLEGDVEITWSDTLDFDRDDQRAVFKGKVNAKSGDKSIDCDMLAIQFAEAPTASASGRPAQVSEKKYVLKRVDAEGHVRLAQGAQQGGMGDTFTYDAASDMVLLQGRPAKANGQLPKSSYHYYIEGPMIKILNVNQPNKDIRVDGKGLLVFSIPQITDIQSLARGQKIGDVVITWNDKMVFDQIAGKGAFEWNTEVTYGTHRVQSRRLDVTFNAANQLDEVRASGNVYLFDTETDQEATGELLVWKDVQNEAVLTGSPDATLWFGTKGKAEKVAAKTSSPGQAAKPSGRHESDSDFASRLRIRCEGRVSSALELDNEKGSRMRTQAEKLIISGLLPSRAKNQ